MRLKFADWLRTETTTSTACVAGFARPVMGPVRRDWLGVWAADDPFFRKREKRRRLQESREEGDLGRYRRIPDGVIKIPVPSVQQTTKFSCGAAVTHSVFCYFGVGPEEQEEYMDKLKTDPAGGTAPDDIVKFCKDHGLSAKKVEGMTVDALVGHVESGRPVILAIQAYGTKKDYRNWASGHYVIAIGYDEKNVYFEDPSSAGRRTFTSRADLDTRWHDYDKHGDEYRHLGIVVWKRGHPGYTHKAKKLQ